MGRRHLGLAAGIAAGSLLVVPASQAAKIAPWRVVSAGAASGPQPAATEGALAYDRAAAASFASRLPAAARARLAGVDYPRTAVVVVFGEFGCKDHRIAVSGIDQRGGALVVHLVERPPTPGTVECMAIFPTFRLLTVDKSALHRPYPTRARVTLLARA
jgi:hypothetical protein